MKMHPFSLRQFLIAMLILLVLPLAAQTKKGFKKLDDKDWDAALEAFAKDTSNAELQAVAWYGMAKVLCTISNPKKNYVLGMAYQDKAAAAWDDLPKSARSEITKEYEVGLTKIQGLRTQTTTNAWRAIERNPKTTLQEIGDYMQAFPDPPEDIREAVKEKRGDLLGEAVRSAKTYADYSYLLNTFQDEIQETFPNALQSMNRRIFELFMEEQGSDWLGRFYRENRQHPLSYDDARDVFPETWNSEELQPFLQFLAQYPNSGFSPYIRQRAVEIMQANTPDDATVQTFAPEERGALEEIKMEMNGELIDPEGPFDESMHEKWLNYIRKTAPTDRANVAFNKMYNFYMADRKWKRASQVLYTARPVFPLQEERIKQLLAIVDGPEYGIKPVNAGPNINSSASEYVPVPSTDNKTLYFCANSRPDNLDGEDVFVSYKKDTGWTKAVVIKELSGFYNQAPVSLSGDGQTLMLFNGGKSQTSTKTASGWTKPVLFDSTNLKKFGWVGLVQVAANNRVMVFEASEYSGWFGGDRNIYISERQPDGKWGTPIKLDSTINSAGDERSPYLHPDMHTLYFSTDSKPGLGGLDVYKTTRIGDSWTRWTTPVNLGKEINTMNDDWAYKITTDGTVAWFSNRGEDDNQDIYYVELPPEMRPQVVKVINVDTRDKNGKPFDGNVVVTDPATGKVVGEYKTNPRDGNTTIPVPNDKTYTITLEKEGTFPTSITVPVETSGKSTTSDVVLKPQTVADMVTGGQTAELNLLFDYDKTELRSESIAELTKVAAIAKTGNYRINLFGYSDNAGGTDYNTLLSQKRAESTRQALINLGIPADTITAKGLGETNPIADNATEAGRARNRRVEVQYTNK